MLHPWRLIVNAGFGRSTSLRISRTDPDCSKTSTLPLGIPTMPVDAPSVAIGTSVNPLGTVAAATRGAAMLTTGTTTAVISNATAENFRMSSPFKLRPRERS